MELIIKNGIVVTAKEMFKSDIGISNGKIVALGSDLKDESAKVVDVAGKLVLPGAIDAHTHLAMPFGGTVSADNYEAGTRAAACGGVTTVFDYPMQRKGHGIIETVDSKRKIAEKEACCDFAFHC